MKTKKAHWRITDELFCFTGKLIILLDLSIIAVTYLLHRQKP
jgi:hypothetical protein